MSEVSGISEAHIERALTAAKNPQLDMKLRNMPVPLHADLIEMYMRLILEAAWEGKFDKIKSMQKT
jgi:hypothetical protein